MVHDLRRRAEPALAIVQARGHGQQLWNDRSPHLFRQHSLRYRALRGLAPTRHISQIHNQQSGKAIFQGRFCGQRSALFDAFRQPAVRVLVGQEKVFQYLRGVPLPRRSHRQIAGTGARHCILEFPPQTFKIRNHGSIPVRRIQHGSFQYVSSTMIRKQKSTIGK